MWYLGLPVDVIQYSFENTITDALLVGWTSVRMWAPGHPRWAWHARSFHFLQFFLQIAKFCTTTIFASATLKIDALCNTQLLMHEISPHETYGQRFVSTNAIHSTISLTFALSREIRPLCKTLAPPNLSPTNFLEAELFTQPNWCIYLHFLQVSSKSDRYSLRYLHFCVKKNYMFPLSQNFTFFPHRQWSIALRETASP